MVCSLFLSKLSCWPFMRNGSFRNSARFVSHVGDISLSGVMFMDGCTGCEVFKYWGWK